MVQKVNGWGIAFQVSLLLSPMLIGGLIWIGSISADVEHNSVSIQANAGDVGVLERRSWKRAAEQAALIAKMESLGEGQKQLTGWLRRLVDRMDAVQLEGRQP